MKLKLITQTKDYKELIIDWLKTNEPSVVVIKSKMPHVVSGKGLCNNAGGSV